MKAIQFITVILLLSQFTFAQKTIKRPTYVPGEIIIGYEKLYEDKSSSPVRNKIDNEYKGLVNLLNQELSISIKGKGPVQKWLVDQMKDNDMTEREFLRMNKTASSNTTVNNRSLLYQQLIIRIDDDTKVDSIINLIDNKIYDSYKIKFAIRNGLSYTDAMPNDTLLTEQWSHKICKTDSAWNTQTGDSSVVIGILDTGVDYTHEDLKGNIVPGYDFVNIDLGGMDSLMIEHLLREDLRYIRDEDYITPDDDPMDYHGHGTHCAGIAGAVGNNRIGVAGVSYHSSIMPLRVGYTIKIDTIEYGTMEDDDVANGIVYAANHGVDILSMSFGGSYSEVVKLAIEYAQGQGVIMVGAAGNSNSQTKEYPASYPNVISVGATTEKDERTYFSNFGNRVDIMAPGIDILSTVPKLKGTLHDPSGYKTLSGTSMAAPYIAGVIALIKSEYPSYSNEEIISTLLNTADDIDSLNSGFNAKLGAGRVNAAHAVNWKPRPNIKIQETTLCNEAGDPKYLTAPGDKASLKVCLKNHWLGAGNVSLKLSTTDRYVALNDSVFSFDTLAMNEIKSNSANPFNFHVDKTTPDNHIVNFNLCVSTGEHKVCSPISFQISIQDTIRIPTDYASIQKGIDASNSGDLIIIEPGEYFENINFKGKNITVASRFYETNDKSFIEKTVINGSSVVDTISTDDIHGSVVFIGNGENRAAKLIGLTLTKGTGTNFTRIGETQSVSMGGAVLCYNSSPELRSLRIIDNEASSSSVAHTGAGICMNECKQPPLLEDIFLSANHGSSAISGYYGDAVLNNIRINDNKKGIGIYFYSNSGTISNTEIQNCTGLNSSGIEIAQSDSIFINNIKTNKNGYCGIYLNSCQKVQILNAEITYNKFAGIRIINCHSAYIQDAIINKNKSRGIIVSKSPSIQIQNTEIKNNKLGIQIGDCSFADICNSVITDNYPDGAINIHSSNLNLINSTLANNTIKNHYGGGAIFYMDDSKVNIVNSILYNNRWITLISPVDTCFNSISFLEDAGKLMVAYSNIQKGQEGIHYDDDGKSHIQLDWLNGNLDTIPMFFKPEQGDYHLFENSPVKNKGTENFTFDNEILVNLDSSEYFGSHPDMGAYLLPTSYIKPEFVADRTLGKVPMTVKFTNQSYSYYSAPPDSFVWVFGGKDTSYVFEPIYMFTKQGEYSVALSAFNKATKGFIEKTSLIKVYEIDTLYVDKLGSDTTGIGTQQLPFQTIQNAINKAEEYDVIIVNPGLYSENVLISEKDLTLASMFYLTNDTTYISRTIIDGNQNGSVIKIDNTTSLSNIIGLTLQNGAQLGEKDNYSGAGIDCNNSNFNLKHCVIQNNVARHFGGGLYLYDSSPIIENCLIANNKAEFNEKNGHGVGGGIYVGGESNPVIRYTSFINNRASDDGGGIHFYSETKTVLDRTTFYGNVSSKKTSGGVYVGYSSQPIIRNSIFWGNTPTQIFEYKKGNSTISYCNIQDGYSGTNNINVSPKFVDVSLLNLNLLPNSPCINSGDPNSEKDPDGTPADMGAYFYYHQLPVIQNSLGNQIVCNNSKATFFVSVNGIKPFQYSWYKDNRLIGSSKDTLYIHNVLNEDAGNYYCSVVDALKNTVRTNEAVLTLLPTYETIVDTTICKGENYFAGGQLQTLSGQYYDTYSSRLGCDSTIITNLMVTNCLGNKSISKNEDGIVFPNPTNGKLTIKSGSFKEVEIFNVKGDILFRFTEKQIDISFLPNGIYYLKVFTTNSEWFISKITLIK